MRHLHFTTFHPKGFLDDISLHFKRPNKLTPLKYVPAACGDVDFGQRIDGEAESMAYHTTDPGGLCHLDHLNSAMNSSLLHHLDLHNPRSLLLDDLNEGLRSHDGLIGHDGNFHRLSYLRHTSQITALDRLLEKRHIERSYRPSQPDGVINRVGFVGVNSEDHLFPNSLPHCLNPIPIRPNPRTHFDLCRAKAAL